MPGMTPSPDAVLCRHPDAGKHEILDNELAAERMQLSRMAAHALAPVSEVEPGPEALREAVTALLIATPRYRTYVTAHGAQAPMIAR